MVKDTLGTAHHLDAVIYAPEGDGWDTLLGRCELEAATCVIPSMIQHQNL